MANKEYRDEMRDFRRETNWTIWHWLPIVVVVLVIAMGLGWFAQGNDFFMYKIFAPKYQQVEREVFEQTKSYRQGMIRDIRRMQQEYISADKEHKDALASVILHTAADFPEADMPNDVLAFLNQLKRDRNLKP